MIMHMDLEDKVGRAGSFISLHYIKVGRRHSSQDYIGSCVCSLKDNDS